VHAITNAAVLAAEDLGIRAAAIAAGGASVALHVRDHTASGNRLTALTQRFITLASPPEAAVLVNGHPDIAAATGAHGVELSQMDLRPDEARLVFADGWIGCSVHSLGEAEMAVTAGADFLVVGSIFPSASHPGAAPAGTALVTSCASLGLPVIAIGGITAERIGEVKAAGAYGVAAISALWHARDPAAATIAFLEKLRDSGE
jgi:thiazole tautomerase (transcriptional regulator TenI)